MVPIREAYGRVLAEDVISNVDIPFQCFPLYGYAIRAEDTPQASVNNPILLRVVSIEERGFKISFGEAAYILTGAQLAMAANTVIPVKMLNSKVTLSRFDM